MRRLLIVGIAAVFVVLAVTAEADAFWGRRARLCGPAACCPDPCEPACCPAPDPCEPVCCAKPRFRLFGRRGGCCPDPCEPACCAEPDPCETACSPDPCCRRPFFRRFRQASFCCPDPCCDPCGPAESCCGEGEVIEEEAAPVPAPEA